MALNSKTTPFLYSAGTLLAYRIAKKYYGNTHYVWCTTAFNCKNQPITSNPLKICKRYLEQISTGDRHAKEIANNIAGILRGAKEKYNKGVITSQQYNDILSTVSVAQYDAFYPIIYVIESKKVLKKCREVAKPDKASDEAIEYQIIDLQEGEFEIISFKDILDDIISVSEKKAGE